MENAEGRETKNVPAGKIRPKLRLYHANAKGTGVAIKLELHPAHDDTDGCIMMTMANQATVADRRGAKASFATFAWERALTVKLDFSDLARIVQVLRGESESIEDGKGLYHSTARFSTRISLRHCCEPHDCFLFELYRSSRCGEGDSNARIVLSRSEALGLCLAFENSFGVICFGIPQVFEREEKSVRREMREARNAPAA